MQITDIQACVIKGFGEWILVKVYTDTEIYGIGEAYPSHSMGKGTKEIIEGMKWMLVGEDPRDVERLTGICRFPHQLNRPRAAVGGHDAHAAKTARSQGTGR